MKHILFGVVFFCVTHLASANFTVEIITDQLKRPWSLAFLPDGRFLVTERSGKLRIVSKEGMLSQPVTGLPTISAIGQGGLLDVVLHPGFDQNKWVYISYVSGNSSAGYSTEVVRGTLNVSTAELTNTQSIFVALPKVQGGRHFGSRLLFDRSGYLYISLGDRGDRQHSQNPKTHHGSIIRLHDDGRIPSDNPFVNNSSFLPEIYSYGHRNVQGMTLHPLTGKVWTHEHGPQGGDEVNVIDSGKNYGWPVITYGAEYGSGFKIGQGVTKQGMEQPVHFWDPSIAPSGMAFFKNDLLVGALKFRLLAQLQLKDELVVREQRLFSGQFGRIRDVRTFNDKIFYLLTDANNGKLIRITDSSE